MPFYYQLSSEQATHRRVADRLLLLRQKLAEEIPRRTLNESLLLATWNIREFDSGKYGARTDEAYHYIAEIISHFDIVAIQEVKADLKALTKLMRILGPWWKYIITDVTAGSAGNRERGAFVFDSRKVRFGGLSGEIVIPPVKNRRPARQLARTPFVCGFQAGWLKVMICTVHIYYGKAVANDPKRLEEIRLLSKFLAGRVKEAEAWSSNLVLLGDFNIFDVEDPTFKAITKAGFFIPPQFKDYTSNAAGGKHFDQMAFISHAFDPELVRRQLASWPAGVFDFFRHVYTDDDEQLYTYDMGRDYRLKSSGGRRKKREKQNYYRQWRTFQMSDHFPMWIELRIDFGQPYLERIREGGEKPHFG